MFLFETLAFGLLALSPAYEWVVTSSGGTLVREIDQTNIAAVARRFGFVGLDIACFASSFSFFFSFSCSCGLGLRCFLSLAVLLLFLPQRLLLSLINLFTLFCSFSISLQHFFLQFGEFFLLLAVHLAEHLISLTLNPVLFFFQTLAFFVHLANLFLV